MIKSFLEVFQFGESVTSRFAERPWHSRQKVPNYLPWTTAWFWSVCLDAHRKNPPISLPKLVNTVERYAASLNKDKIVTAVNDILPRAQACIESDGGAFEYKLT